VIQGVRKEGEMGVETPFALRGGHLALDFANTVGWHAHEEPTEQAEYLTSYARFLAWARQTGALPDPALDQLAARAAASPTAAAAALREVIALREAVYHLFSAQAAGRPLPAADLAAFNAALAEAHAHLRVVPAAAGPTLGWDTAGDDSLTRPLWPVARAAAELLTSPECARARECAGGSCGWLFLDTSRNGSRRWCDSRDCGNRERVRRHYARQKRNGL
jgi:predicted RNA-binding Zn ribbon-like protein